MSGLQRSDPAATRLLDLAEIRAGGAAPGSARSSAQPEYRQDETTEVGYFSLSDIEHLDIGDFDRQRIADGFAAQTAAFVR